MIGIIDYGVGNIFSLQSSFKSIGADIIFTGDKDKIKNCDKLILPGVGAFEDAVKKLRESGMEKVVLDAAAKLRNTGLDEVLKAEADKGKYIMGICLGMQMMFDKSFEYGEHDGLGLIRGNVVPLSDVCKKVKIPHMGWNSLKFHGEKSPIFKHINEGDYVYFVHSYYATDCLESTIATTDYEEEVTAAVQKDNIFALQFHPEKSGNVGLNILKAFCELGE